MKIKELDFIIVNYGVVILLQVVTWIVKDIIKLYVDVKNVVLNFYYYIDMNVKVDIKIVENAGISIKDTDFQIY